MANIGSSSHQHPCKICFFLRWSGCEISELLGKRAWLIMALFGTWADLQNFRTLPDVLGHFNVPDPVWQSLVTHLGDPGNDIGLFSALPATSVVAACGLAVTLNGALTPIEATQVGLVWRLCRRVVAFRGGVGEAEFVDVDPWRPVETPEPKNIPAGDKPTGSGLKESVLKMASIIDQQDDSELLPPGSLQVNNWFQNYIAVMGAPPDETEEPTGAQLAALHKRTNLNDQAPYVDFAIWVPYGRRMSKVNKTRVYTPLGDGSYLYKDLPGPGSFQAWTSSWKVFKAACLMLNIANLAALEAYYRTIEKLVIQYPQCWGLIFAADDTARAERLEKLRRSISIEAGLGRQIPSDWLEGAPWSCVFQQLAKDMQFWAERVHHPAAAWIAAGSKGAPSVASEQAVLGHLPGAEDLQDVPEPNTEGSRKKQANRDKRQALKKRKLAEREELRSFRAAAASGGTQPKGKGKGKNGGKTKDQAGSPLCFSWASGTGPCGKLPPGAECACAVKRTHKCRKCLSPSHQDDACPS